MQQDRRPVARVSRRAVTPLCGIDRQLERPGRDAPSSHASHVFRRARSVYAAAMKWLTVVLVLAIGCKQSAATEPHVDCSAEKTKLEDALITARDHAVRERDTHRKYGEQPAADAAEKDRTQLAARVDAIKSGAPLTVGSDGPADTRELLRKYQSACPGH
jgi:hypothetical protein